MVGRSVYSKIPRSRGSIGNRLLCPKCKMHKVLKQSKLSGRYFCKNCREFTMTMDERLHYGEKK